jgi:hypothetical protein
MQEQERKVYSVDVGNLSKESMDRIFKKVCDWKMDEHTPEETELFHTTLENASKFGLL